MKKKALTIVLAVFLFLFALGLTLYPVISNYVNSKYASEIHTAYEEIIAEADNSALVAALEAAIAYNDAIRPGSTFAESYSQEAIRAASENYEEQLNISGSGIMG